MNKTFKLILSLTFLPLMVFAHNPGGAIISYAISFFLGIILSLVIFKFTKQKIKIENKYLKFFALFVLELGLLLISTILLMSTLGIFIYINCFGG